MQLPEGKHSAIQSQRSYRAFVDLEVNTGLILLLRTMAGPQLFTTYLRYIERLLMPGRSGLLTEQLPVEFWSALPEQPACTTGGG